MKHIREILAERRLRLFGKAEEKGSAEWSAFNPVRGDSVAMYRVHVPTIARQPRYPNTIRIHRERPKKLVVRSLVLGPRMS